MSNLSNAEMARNQLITIGNTNGKETVNARELHEFLENKRQFSDWVKQRIEQYGFLENIDYVLISQNCETRTGGTVRKEYYISLDMAKELSMVENNEKGKQARQYFIECERRVKKPLSLEEMTLLVVEGQKKKIEQLECKIEADKPKVDFYETVADSKDTISMSEVAKVLGLSKGNVTLFRILREHGILQQNNEPYQEYVTRGYFKLIEQTYLQGEEIKVRMKTVVFQKGVNYIRSFIEKRYPDLLKKGA